MDVEVKGMNRASTHSMMASLGDSRAPDTSRGKQIRLTTGILQDLLGGGVGMGGKITNIVKSTPASPDHIPPPPPRNGVVKVNPVMSGPIENVPKSNSVKRKLACDDDDDDLPPPPPPPLVLSGDRRLVDGDTPSHLPPPPSPPPTPKSTSISSISLAIPDTPMYFPPPSDSHGMATNSNTLVAHPIDGSTPRAYDLPSTPDSHPPSTPLSVANSPSTGSSNMGAVQSQRSEDYNSMNNDGISNNINMDIDVNQEYNDLNEINDNTISGSAKKRKVQEQHLAQLITS